MPQPSFENYVIPHIPVRCLPPWARHTHPSVCIAMSFSLENCWAPVLVLIVLLALLLEHRFDNLFRLAVHAPPSTACRFAKVSGRQITKLSHTLHRTTRAPPLALLSQKRLRWAKACFFMSIGSYPHAVTTGSQSGKPKMKMKATGTTDTRPSMDTKMPAAMPCTKAMFPPYSLRAPT